MKKANVFTALYNFARKEEHELIKQGKEVEAYQIENARAVLLYALHKSIKHVKETLEKMTAFEIDKKGVWHYDAAKFVHDETTRKLLIDLKEHFNF